MRPTVRALMLAVIVALPGHPAWGQEAEDQTGSKVTSRGGLALSAGGGVSSSGFSIGGSVGYFITDNVLPGVRYYYARYKYDDPSVYSRTQTHDVSVFLRYYVPHLERIYPFVVVEPGFHAYTVTSTATADDGSTETTSSHGSTYTAYAGLGAVLMVTEHIGVEPNVGLKQDLGSGEGPYLDWWIGLGLYP